MKYWRNIQWGMIILLSVFIALINVSEAEISGSVAYIYDTDVMDAKSFTGYPDSMTSDRTTIFINVEDYMTSDLSFIPVQTPSPPVHYPTLSPYFNFQLNLSSIPQGADIFIDDVYVGKNPKKITITDQSTHTLRLDLKGYEEEERFFQFDVGKGEKVIETILQKPFGPVKTPILVPTPTMVPHFNFQLNLSSVPQGADIFIDDVYVGKTPKKITITDLSTHTLRLDLKGYEEEERFFQFDVGEGEKVIETILQEPFGPVQTLLPVHTLTPGITSVVVPHFNFQLNLSSVPQGADIFIDDVYVGKTPKKITITDLSTHTLRLDLKGYEEEEKTFEFRLNKTNEMMINMNKIQTTPTLTTPVPTSITPVPTSTTPVPTSTTLIPTSITPVPTFAKPTAIPTSPQVPGFIAKTFLLTILCGYLLVIILRR